VHTVYIVSLSFIVIHHCQVSISHFCESYLVNIEILNHFCHLCPLSHSDLYHTPEGRTSGSTPRGTAEAARVTTETTGWAGRTWAEDERAADGQWEQTERAGGHEEGL